MSSLSVASNIRRQLADESGAGMIIEYTIVFPIVLAIVMSLIFVGYTLHERAVVESATARAATYGAKTLSDTNFTSVVRRDTQSDSNEAQSVSMSGVSISNDPYRYFGLLATGTQSMDDCADMAKTIIRKNQLFTKKEPTVTAYKSGGVFTKVTVTARQDFKLPVMPFLDLPPVMTIQAKGIAYANEPSEFIRNADYAIELLDKYTGVKDKVKTLFDKLNIFKKTTG